MAARIADKPPKRWTGRGRGICALSPKQTTATERRPGNPGDDAGSTQRSDERPESGSVANGCQRSAAVNRPWEADRPHSVRAGDRQQATTTEHGQRPLPPASCEQRDNANTGPTRKPENESVRAGAGKEMSLLAGYSYKANPDSPLGSPELSVKQGQSLTLVRRHPGNEHWWWVREESGSEGYVPANYMVIKENKLSTLPWLANKKPEEDIPSEKPTWKAYNSAYNKTAPAETDKDRYYCRLCDKKLNGPQPYRAHMVSKAHREVEAVAREMEEEEEEEV